MMLSHLLKLVCFFLATFPTLSLAARKWDYSGAANWKGNCAASNQSPINIKTADVVTDDSKAVTFSDWDKASPTVNHYHALDDHTIWHISNNMHGKMKFDGKTYQMFFGHYRWGSDSSKGSEHSVNGNFYAGELEMFFYNTKYQKGNNTKYQTFEKAKEKDDGVAVLSFLLNERDDLTKDIPLMTAYIMDINKLANKNTPTLDEDKPILDYYNKNVLKLANQSSYIFTIKKNKYTLRGVVADDMCSYRYKGTLPFPPCKKNVEWVIIKKPLDVTNTFMKALRALTKKDRKPLWNSFRPRQDLGSRTVYDVPAEVIAAS